jgi:N-acetylmuramoyl-L-alanine amidase
MSPRPFKNAFFASAYAFLAPTIALGVIAFPISVFAQNFADRGPGAPVRQASELLTIAGGEVILKTESSAVAGRPQFRYLPGSNGDTVLTADFEGLSWNYPTKIIRLNSPEKGLSNGPFTGIREIRIGQFQASPSILRVSFIARDPAVLKKVAIGAAPGILKLSWKGAAALSGSGSGANALSGVSSSKKNSALPSKAPSMHLASAREMPPLAVAKSEPLAIASAKSSALASAPNSSSASKAAKGGWLARLRSKTKDYFSAPPEQAPEEVAPVVAPAIAQTSPAAAKAARMPAVAPSSIDGESIISAFPPLTTKERTTGGAARASVNASGTSTGTSTGTGSGTGSGTSTGTGTGTANRDFSDTNDGSDIEKPELPLGPPPLITLETADPQGSGAKLEIFRVERPDGKQLSFKSFRLHNPERYVVDMPDYRELANSVLPDVSTSPLVSSMRVGLPGEAEGSGRLVLQLTDDTVSIDESFNSGSSYMTVTLAKGLTGNSGIARSGNLAFPVAASNGPILVPRAPSETVVVLDAGHGGNDPGAVRGDVQEKEVTLQIINKLKKVLESKGARIVLTRSDDTFVSLEDRVKITNTVSPNLFLSVHINSLESTSNIYGIETYFQTDQSRPLADRVHGSLVSGLGAPDRSVRKARFYVINHTPIPAILAEVGYITNKAERDRLISSDYQQKVASALARGVMLYLQDIKSQNGFANNSAGSVSSSSDAQKPSRLATGSGKLTK